MQERRRSSIDVSGGNAQSYYERRRRAAYKFVDKTTSASARACLQVVKFFFVVGLFGLSLLSLLLARVGSLRVVEVLANSSQTIKELTSRYGDPEIPEALVVEHFQSSLLLMVLLMASPLFSLVVSFWRFINRESRAMMREPRIWSLSIRKISIITIEALFEISGLLVLIFVVLPKIGPVLGSLLLSSAVTFGCVLEFVVRVKERKYLKRLKRQRSGNSFAGSALTEYRSLRRCILCAIVALFHLVGVTGLTFSIANDENFGVTVAVPALLALVCVSMSFWWTVNVNYFAKLSDPGRAYEALEGPEVPANARMSLQDDSGVLSVSHPRLRYWTDLQRSFIRSLLFFIAIYSFVHLTKPSEESAGAIATANWIYVAFVENITKSAAYLPFLITLVGFAGAYLSWWLAQQVSVTFFTVILPSIVTAPIAALYLSTSCAISLCELLSLEQTGLCHIEMNWIATASCQGNGLPSLLPSQLLFLSLMWLSAQLFYSRHVVKPISTVVGVEETMNKRPPSVHFLLDTYLQGNHTTKVSREFLRKEYKAATTAPREVEKLPGSEEDKPFVLLTCTCLFNEADYEVERLLSSLQQVPGTITGWEMFDAVGCHGVPPGYGNVEHHLIVDDAFDDEELQRKRKSDGDGGPFVGDNASTVAGDRRLKFKYLHGNRFVHMLRAILDEYADSRFPILEVYTNYGRCWKGYFKRPDGDQSALAPFCIHLKNSKKVKPWKRNSQAFLFHLFETMEDLLHDPRLSDDPAMQHWLSRDKAVYVCTLDGDMKFEKQSVLELVSKLRCNKQLGGICGRVQPLGPRDTLSIVGFYQLFEYTYCHLLQKTAENAFGSVLCCPGCYSIFRLDALRTILPEYEKEIDTGAAFVQYALGEDRLLCTLLLENGYKLSYVPSVQAYTHVPDSFHVFFKQRRRWNPSALMNNIRVIKNAGKIMKSSQNLSFPFFVYVTAFVFISLLAPATASLVILGGFEYANIAQSAFANETEGSAPSMASVEWASITFGLVLPVVYGVLCFILSLNAQITVAKWMAYVYGFVMTFAIVGLVAKLINNFFAIDTYYILSLIGIHLVAALFDAPYHPKSILAFFAGILYLLAFPAANIFLFIFSIANVHQTTWGTREREKVPEKPTLAQRLFDGAFLEALKRWSGSEERTKGTTAVEREAGPAMIGAASSHSVPMTPEISQRIFLASFRDPKPPPHPSSQPKANAALSFSNAKKATTATPALQVRDSGQYDSSQDEHSEEEETRGRRRKRSDGEAGRRFVCGSQEASTRSDDGSQRHAAPLSNMPPTASFGTGAVAMSTMRRSEIVYIDDENVQQNDNDSDSDAESVAGESGTRFRGPKTFASAARHLTQLLPNNLPLDMEFFEDKKAPQFFLYEGEELTIKFWRRVAVTKASEKKRDHRVVKDLRRLRRSMLFIFGMNAFLVSIVFAVSLHQGLAFHIDYLGLSMPVSFIVLIAFSFFIALQFLTMLWSQTKRFLSVLSFTEIFPACLRKARDYAVLYDCVPRRIRRASGAERRQLGYERSGAVSSSSDGVNSAQELHPTAAAAAAGHRLEERAGRPFLSLRQGAPEATATSSTVASGATAPPEVSAQEGSDSDEDLRVIVPSSLRRKRQRQERQERQEGQTDAKNGAGSVIAELRREHDRRYDRDVERDGGGRARKGATANEEVSVDRQSRLIVVDSDNAESIIAEQRASRRRIEMLRPSPFSLGRPSDRTLRSASVDAPTDFGEGISTGRVGALSVQKKKREEGLNAATFAIENADGSDSRLVHFSAGEAEDSGGGTAVSLPETTTDRRKGDRSEGDGEGSATAEKVEKEEESSQKKSDRNSKKASSSRLDSLHYSTSPSP